MHRCTSCGSSAPKWAGRCDGCGEWNTLVEEIDVREEPRRAAAAGVPVPIAQVVDEHGSVRSTGLSEVDRVLGGGVVAGRSRSSAASRASASRRSWCNSPVRWPSWATGPSTSRGGVGRAGAESGRPPAGVARRALVGR
ncbi:MAG: hypothetical protein R2695_17325 [Acidimicrobiales bacterium]